MFLYFIWTVKVMILEDYDEIYIFNMEKSLKRALQRGTIKSTIDKSKQSSKNCSKNLPRKMEKNRETYICVCVYICTHMCVCVCITELLVIHPKKLRVMFTRKTICGLATVVSDSFGQYSIRLLCPWDSPGKNTGVGCHTLLQRSSQFRDQSFVSCLLHWEAGSLRPALPAKLLDHMVAVFWVF